MKIQLAPIKFNNSQLLFRVRDTLKQAFHAKITVIDLPLNPAVAFSKEREQYFSTKLIAEAIKLTRKNDDKVVMIVDFDLFVPVFTFLFGEAQLRGKHSIVSACRLHEEFYSGESDDEKLFFRTMKEVMHELGHNFGLKHCQKWDCVMHTSTSVEEIDIKGDTYCSDCAQHVSHYNNAYIGPLDI